MPVLLDPQVIEDEATRAPIAEVAATLQRALGQKPVAYLAGISDAKLVGQWARGKVTPRADAQTRMREAYKAVAMIRSAYGDDTARAWLFGCNSRLDDHAPAWVLRHASDPEDFELVVPTARAFAAGGA
jgi:hypothetical protein